MKFWICYRCKRIKIAAHHEIVPPMNEGWAYKLLKPGTLGVLCPACKAIGEINGSDCK